MSSTGLGFGTAVFTAYGTHGDFTIGSGTSRTAAKFILTKIRPGNDGSWENTLARKLRPWREVFSVANVTFDELLQRDLDDSRVAMDLIPYLLGDGQHSSRFFPPILAVLVPIRPDKAGIIDVYPAPTQGNQPSARFGNLFRVDPITLGEEGAPPTAQLTCNDAKAGFVIADGQHRAMAVLAINRILTNGWDRDPYATYYKHLTVSEEQASSIELPVCIVYFPELNEDNKDLKLRGITLTSVCRDLFLTVNKTAKAVSKSRQLLLDDDDIAARMMRNTLSKLKDRPESDIVGSRVHCFAFGDAEKDLAAQDVTGRLSYSSAQLIYRVHAASCFADPDILRLESEKDVTDRRAHKNSSRAVEVLRSTFYSDWNAIGRTSARLYSDTEVRGIVHLLGQFSDGPLMTLFDKFLPFVSHNRAMSWAKNRLEDPSARANETQAKCATLLFEGSGARGIFEEHLDRIRGALKDPQGGAANLKDYFKNQEKDAQAVESALQSWEKRIKERRALNLLRIELPESTESSEIPKEAEELTRGLFAACWTQAFQLGFCTLVHGVVRLLTDGSPLPHAERVRWTRVISEALVAGMNAYLAGDDPAVHRTLTKEQRSNTRLGVFDTDKLGLRALLSMSVRELNESQYAFFKYAVLELAFSQSGLPSLARAMTGGGKDVADALNNKLPAIAAQIARFRRDLLEAAKRVGLNANDVKIRIATVRGAAEAAGMSAEEAVAAYIGEKEKEIQDAFSESLKTAVGEANTSDAPLLDRMRRAWPLEEPTAKGGA